MSTTTLDPVHADIQIPDFDSFPPEWLDLHDGNGGAGPVDESDGDGGSDAPLCPHCGEACQMIATLQEMVDALGVWIPEGGDDWGIILGMMGGEYAAWRCVSLDCHHNCGVVDAE